MLGRQRARYRCSYDHVYLERDQFGGKTGETVISASSVAQFQGVPLSFDVAESAHVGQALSLVGKRGKVVMTAVPHPTDATVDLSLVDMTFYEKQLRGSLFGSSSPRDDIFRLLGLYESGSLKLDELITREYALEDINEAYEDTLSGLNLRGLIRF